MSTKEFYLGTAVKIKTVLDISNPTSVKITIKDSSYRDIVVAQDMTKIVDKNYQYIWQSSEFPALIEGDYDIMIYIVAGGYTTLAIEQITMLDARNRYVIES